MKVRLLTTLEFVYVCSVSLLFVLLSSSEFIMIGVVYIILLHKFTVVNKLLNTK